MESIRKTEFKKLFFDFLAIREKQHIEAANQWAQEKLFDVESIAKKQIEGPDGKMIDNSPEKIDAIRIEETSKIFVIRKIENE
jgi:hypothetical protein